MILPLFRRAPQAGTISALYGTIVAQARLAAFYRDYGVPDTVDGRFELIALHLALFLRRLSGEGEDLRALGQQVFDYFCQDMDQNLREMGVGDLKVPEEMQRIGAAFYGRAAAYEAALAGTGLAAAVARNIYGNPDSPHAERLAAYIRNVVGHLAEQDPAAIMAGKLDFPRPEQFRT